MGLLTNHIQPVRAKVKKPKGRGQKADSVEMEKAYNARTASERCNKRMKNDYHLEAGRHRSTPMWYVRLYAIVMSLYLDAWLVS